MQTAKFFKKDGYPYAFVGDKLYKGYTLTSLPSNFGFIYDEDKDQDGLSQWFNYKGLTYIW
jgi:hypothetical protein